MVAIRNIRPDEHPVVLDLVTAEIRPPGSETGPADDFPIALGRDNLEGIFGVIAEGNVVACLATLVRPFLTSVGRLEVAGIGSVVTHPDHRGNGHSRRLQEAVLDHLCQRGVPLAVLWSDHPEYYAGRGFVEAGVEYHLDLATWRPTERALSAGFVVRRYQTSDVTAISDLHAACSYRTVRRDGEAKQLYDMPGTEGWVLVDAEQTLQAYLFCGKGADFPRYGLEWGGDPATLTRLLAQVHGSGVERWLLAPQGAKPLRDLLQQQSAGCRAFPSGLWKVLNVDLLRAGAAAANTDMPPDGAEGVHAWLGRVDPDGSVHEGQCKLAVWGFDSV
ncbi:MAG: GNAT family N-acetyltransferase [bacterium]